MGSLKMGNFMDKFVHIHGVNKEKSLLENIKMDWKMVLVNFILPKLNT